MRLKFLIQIHIAVLIQTFIPALSLATQENKENISEQTSKNEDLMGEEAYKLGQSFYEQAKQEKNPIIQYDLYEKAFRLINKSASQGILKAQYNLGLMYKYGQGIGKSYKEALEWLKKAAEHGDAGAQYNVGMLYYNGQGVEKSYKEALEWLKKAAEHGDVGAQYNVGMLYYNGQGVEKSYKEALEWLKKAAEHGDAGAQYNVGMLYYNGQGVEKSYKEALEWLKKVAEHGDAGAQYNVGMLYYNGQGVEKSYKEALEWLKKAAEHGDVGAQYNVGMLYYNGQGVEKSYKEALEWLKKAAEHGDAMAQYKVGQIYFNREGDIKQPITSSVEAFKWFKKAARNGHIEAQKKIGKMFFHGEGIKRSDANGIEELMKAAKQDAKQDQDFKLYLILSYYMGWGVLKNIRKSKMHFNETKCERLSELFDFKSPCIIQFSEKICFIIDYIRSQENLFTRPRNNIYTNTLILEQIKEILQDNKKSNVKNFLNYKKFAEEGDGESQLKLGILYHYGLGITQDFTRATEWYLEAAQSGNLIAQNIFSIIINKGFNVSNEKWYTRRVFDDDELIEDNQKKGEDDEVFKRRKKGDYETSKRLGELYADNSIERDSSTTNEDIFSWLCAASSQGNIKAQYRLGRMYEYGWGTPKDKKAALQCFKEGAEKGYIPSQKAVAEMYREGRVVEQSNQEALRWYRRAGKQGDAGASAAIKEMADENISAALYDLGRAHEEGWGIARDEDEAITLYSQAALQGYPQAQYAFSVKCLEGKASSREALDPIDLLTILSGEEARRSYLKFMGKSFNKKEKKKLRELQEGGLPEKGYYKAQHKLAELYETGKIIPPKTLKDTLVSYQEAIRLYEAAINSNKPVAITPLARVRSSLEKLKNLSEKDQMKLDHPEFGKLLEEIEESGRNLNPEFLYQLAFLFNEANSFSGSVENKLKNILHTFIRLPESSKQTQGIMQMLTTLTQSKEFKEGFPDKSQEEAEAYRLKELSTIETSINLIRRPWSFIPLPSTLSDHFKVSTILLHDPRIEMFNSYFRQAENDYDPDLFQRSVRKILNLFDRLMKEGYIKGESLYSEDDENFGSRETLEKLLTHNDKPNNRFAHRLIRIADIVYEQFRKDPILVASQLTQWAKRGLNCLTASEEEMNRFYIEYITNTKMDSEALTKEDRTLEMQIALTLAKLRYQLLDTLVEEKDDQRIHSVKHLEKKARWSLGLLGDAENYMDDSGYVVPLKYQKMSVEQITSKILEHYISDFVATHITRQIDDRVIDYDKIIRRLRFQYIRAKVASHGELDESLFRNEDYLLDHCTREEFNKHVLLLDTFNKEEKDHKEILDWDALKEKSYEKAKEQMTEEFYDGNYKGTVKGTKAVLYGMGYLEEEL